MLLAAIIAAAFTFTVASLSLAQQLPDNSVGTGSSQASSADIAARIEYQQVALAQDRSQMAVLDLNIADAEQYLGQRRLQLADANDRLDEAENAYYNSLNMFNGRLSAIYKLGNDDAYSVILSSESFADALSRFSYLATISENDQKLVDRVKSQAEEVRALQKQVDALKQDSAANLAGLEAQKEQLQAKIDADLYNINAATAALAQAQAREEGATRRVAPTAGPATGTGPATIDVGDSPPSGLKPSGITLAGVASWYGPGFNGQSTASGETYNMYAYTAASKTLPFGTWLKVSFNGRSVFVRINDRGPYVGGRILDLSYAAAQSLGLDGIGYVTAEIYD